MTGADRRSGQRVVVTGVQVLFAFLLIVPFNTGFAGAGPFERGVYFVTLLCSALAAVCTIAPAGNHRVLFRSDDKRHVVFIADRVVLVGLVFLALAMCGALLLVTTKLFGAATGAITAGAVAVPFVAIWFAAPLLRRASTSPATRLRWAGSSPWTATMPICGHRSARRASTTPAGGQMTCDTISA